MKIERAAVTGATGFIGSHLLERLRREGIQISAFDRKRHSLEDIRSLEDLVAGCDVVFHLAAKNLPADPELFKVNVLGTANLLQAIESSSPGARVMFSSTFGVYKLPQRGDVINEDFEVSPRNEFGLSKLLAEEFLWFYSSKGSIKASILRISNVYGPGDRPGRSVVANFMDAAKNVGELTVYGDGTQTRDFVYVEDAVNALVNAALARPNFLIINVCSGRETSINQLINLVKEVSGNNIRVLYKDPDTSGGGFWRGDYTLAGRLIDWKPQTTLKHGLRATWTSFK